MAQNLTIIARDMYTAQSFVLSSEQRADLTGRANKVRRIMSAVEDCLVTDLQAMNVPVETPEGARIGYLTYQL